MTRRLLATLVVAALLPAAATQAKTVKAKPMRGTVVHRNHRAHSFVVAGKHGKLRAVHSRRTPRVGRRVALRGRHLANGTFSAKSFKVRGEATRARLRGTVTFVDDASRTFTLSDDGASILVHVADDAIALPAVGDAVRVLADLTQSTASTVEATAVTVLDAPAADTVEIEGVVLAIDETTRTLMISADDEDASGQAVSVVLPDTFDLAAFSVGDRVEILATLNDDGVTFTAVGSSGDDNATEADDQADDQGDDSADDQGDDAQGDDQGVSAGGDDPGNDDSGDSGDDHSGPGSGGDGGDSGSGGGGSD